MFAMDAALLVLKDAGFTFSDLPSSMDRGSFRAVYPHPTNPEEVVKVPHRGLGTQSMIDVATSQAMSAVGEPVIPERLDTIQRNVMVPDPDADWDHTRAPTMAVGTVPQPVFLQQRAPHGPASRTRELFPYTRPREYVVGALANFEGEVVPGERRHKFERLMNLLGGDLHTRNFGFQIPDEEVQALAEQGDMQGLLNNLAAFDMMSEIRPSPSGPEDKYSSGDIARMMRAGDIDPEKLNRFMELFADRSQFDPLMDAIVHQSLPSDEVPYEVKRERRAERKGIEEAYNSYIRAVNNAKRMKSYIDDPYQTRLMEYDMAPLDEAPRNLGNAHPATVLREAIIRARAQQAQDALEGRPPMDRGKLYRKLHSDRNTIGDELRNELMGENPFREMPNIGRLLGDLQEERQMVDRARRSRREEDLR
tara:strand:+ start:1605 stop:2867 length:1263 start_codon:yes stop_codon:yes gene_type:complete